LCQSWNQFVETFNKDSTSYRERIASGRERWMRYSVTSVVQRFHEGSVNASIPCAVPVGIHCPHCSPGAPRINERDLTGYTTNHVPANVKELRAKLACTRHLPRGRSSYGQPQVDHSLQSLHARMEALESVHAVHIAELKQHLNLQKAYVAEPAQITSNICVEMSHVGR
ncbi:hypothetical protein PHMEG_00039379, partial [Phytophthora megakarya]